MDEDLDAGADRVADNRPRGVHKAKLTDMNLEPKLSIFYRPHRNAGMQPLDMAFSKEAAMVFCDRIHSEIERNNGRSYTITGGDLTAYKKIFSWINDCAQSQSVEKFPDIDEPEENPFTPTVNIIIASHHLGVPAGSLSFHLRKRLQGCARKHLMPFSQVRQFYDAKSETYNLDLKAVACASVFNAWWDCRLDESVNPELMEELSDMRDELKELDTDLHEACRVREQEIRKKWAEKKAKKIAEQHGEPAEWNAGSAENDVHATAENTNDGWNSFAEDHTLTHTPANGDWDTQTIAVAAENSFDNWSQPQKTMNDLQDIEIYAPKRSQDWADEMNEPASYEVPQTLPNPQW